MSLSFSIRWALIGLTIGGMIGWGSKLFESTSAPSQALMQKPKFRPAAERPQLGKPNRSLTVTLENLDDLPATGESEVRLQLKVEAMQDLDSEVTLNWNLPAGVDLLAEPNSTAVAIQPGQPYVREVRVRGLSQGTPSVIRLDAYANAKNQPITTQGIFASQPLGVDLNRYERKPQTGSKMAKARKIQTSTAEESRPASRMPARIHF